MKTNIITDKSPYYPALLRQIYRPPQLLYFEGNPEFLNKTCLSIVGTRKNTEYGEFITKLIIEDLSILDIVIVSGLAKGIDTIAHKAALEFSLPTIAVLGSGIDNIYPLENKILAQEIMKNGLIVSEFPGESSPTKYSFPQRNRIISGLSIATIIIEAPENSGALITARFALDQNREIFTVPGDIDRPTSIGPLNLLQNGGAYPVSSGAEIIEILKKQPHLFDSNESLKQKTNIPEQKKTVLTHKTLPIYAYKLGTEEKLILENISPRNATSLDSICAKTFLPPNLVLGILSLLEIQNLIGIINGKYLRKC